MKKAKLVSTYSQPLQTIWMAMHNDYSEYPLTEEIDKGVIPSENTCGEIIVKRLLKGNRGHYGCLEHVPFVFYIQGVTKLDFMEFLDKPGITIIQKSYSIYFKCNARSLLMLLDMTLTRDTLDTWTKERIMAMVQIAKEHIPHIIQWYEEERLPYLVRTQNKGF
jgi:thymidylate synthase ThyX